MIGNHHNRAMDIAFLADRARRSGDSERAVALFRDALDLELEAISQISEPGGIGWAVLHGVRDGWPLGAGVPTTKRLAIKALAEEVDPGQHHRCSQASTNILTRCRRGRGVIKDGLAGFTLLSEFDTRATGFQTMIYRIVQRKLNLPYSGGVPTEIRNQFHAFISPQVTSRWNRVPPAGLLVGAEWAAPPPVRSDAGAGHSADFSHGETGNRGTSRAGEECIGSSANTFG